MRNKKKFRKFMAASLSAIMTFQLGFASFPQDTFASYISADYVLYSADDTFINTYNAVINGNVYTGDSFKYSGKNICYVSEMLNSGSVLGEIRSMNKADSKSNMPDYTNKLASGVDYRKLLSGKAVLGDGEYDLSEAVFAKDTLHIDRTSFSGKGYVRADSDILYDAVKNSDDCELFLYSNKGDIIIQGTDLTINGIIYAPKGKIEINAKNLTINGAVIGDSVELNGTNLTVNKMTDPESPILSFEPDLKFGGTEEIYRENRKITLDISESFGLDQLDTDSLEWSFEADDPKQQACIKTDMATSTNLTKNLIITEAGTYHVHLRGRDKNDESVVYHDIITVERDIAPVAGFWLNTDATERNEEGKAVFELEDTSYSLDGDTIGSRIWSVYFDSDNDGDFDDETEQVFNAGNETKVTYEADSVGKYKFRLKVAEYYTDTIPSLLTENSYLTADSCSNESIKADAEVLNAAPVSYSGISKAKNVDIVVTVGNADVEDINTLSRNIAKVKSSLENKGFSVNLSTVSTSTLTAQDTFAWDEYDHYNYRDSYLPTLEKHIIYEEDSIKMLGYSVEPLRDWLFVDDGISAKRVLSFDMVRDKTDWHSMEGGGFLFNTSIRDVNTAEDGADPKYVKLMNGYCILLTAGGFKLIQFTDLDAESFRNGGVSGSAQSAGKVLMSVPVSNVYDNYNVKIVANGRLLSVFVNNEPKIENFVLPDTNTGTGFGPIICHGGHCCGQQSYFTFSNIKMSTVNGSELSDILDKHEWRESADHFVINLSKESVYELNDKSAVGSAVKSLTENDTEFIGLGTADSKSQYNMLLKSTDGVYMDWYDVLKDPDVILHYVENQLSKNDYSIDKLVTNTDEIVYDGSFVDKENDPVGNQIWDYDLDSSVYENSSRESGKFTVETPLNILEATGLYKIKSKVMDDPTGGNPNLSSYSKWSNERLWTDGLYVHSKPYASISSEILSSDKPNQFICNLTFDAYDNDSITHENKGIVEEKYEWKCVGDSIWTEGTVPKIIDAEEVYLQKYTVCDEQGQWSEPCVEIIYAQKLENTDLFSDDEKPQVQLVVSDENPCKNDTVLISVSAEDNTEVAYVNVKANDKTIAAYQGSILYTFENEGDTEIVVECKDIAGNETVIKKVITVNGPRDVTPPTILIDETKDIVISDGNVLVNGTICDETAFGGYKVRYAQEKSEEYTDVTESAKEVFDGKIASFKLPELSSETTEFTIVIEASDAVGNTSFATFTLNVTAEEVKIEGERTTMPASEKERVDTPANITIKASAEKAEIGDTVIVTVDASDDDGLVALNIYKDGNLIAEAPSEIRFSETEAKTVVIRAESTDAYGGKGEKSLEIVFEDTSDRTPPIAEITAPSNEAPLSGSVEIIGSAYDEKSLRMYQIDYRKDGSSLFIPICSSLQSCQDGKLGVWDTYSLDNAVYELRLTAVDNGGNTQTYFVKYNLQNGAVKEDTPTSDDSLIFFRKPEQTIPADSVLKIEAVADSKLSDGEYAVYIEKAGSDGQQTQVSQGKVANDGTINASVDTSMYEDGSYTITVSIIGKDGTESKETINAIVKHDYEQVDNLYECKITSPEDMDEITETCDIKTSITPDVFTKYKAEFAEAGTNNFTVFDDGIISYDMKELITKLDTTVMSNGNYDIRITVYGDKITASDTVALSVDGELKMGNFSIAFEDLEMNINGLPVTVVRTYDSRSRNSNGEFGYGWSMSFKGAKLEISGVQGENWSQQATASSFITRYTTKETRKHRITVDLGNGVRDEFSMSVSPETQMFYPPTFGLSVNYTALNGSRSTLVPCGVSTGDLLFNGNCLYTESFDVYDPQQFLYTTADGTQYIIDKNSGLLKMTAPNGDTISFNDNGITCSDGKTIKYLYNENGNITNITSNTGATVNYSYNIFGDLVSVIDANGNVTKFTYKQHYITEIIDPRGVRAIRNEYDNEGRLVKTIDPDGNATLIENDPDKKQQVVTDRNGGVSVMTYDNNGNVISETDPMGNTKTYEYDERGNKISETDASGNVKKMKYSSDNKLLSTVDSEGNVTENSYTSKGQLSSISVNGVGIISLTHDASGSITSTTDSEGNVTEYGRDGKGRITSVTDGIGKYMSITYDANGNAVTSADGNGNVSQYTYDDAGNCLTRTYTLTVDGQSKTVTENFMYDAMGNMIQVTDTEGNITKTEYNVIGKISASIDEAGRRTTYEYGNTGNLTKITYPDNTSETFVYDREGNVISATDRLGRTLTMEYDKAGNIISKTTAGGSCEKYTYDEKYNVISVEGANGAITKYEYDTLGRNTAVIDAYGNRTEYTYNENAAVTSVTDANGNKTEYTYDSAGNKIRTVYADGTSVSSTYDSRNRLRSQTDQNGNTTYYDYDGNNKITCVTDALGGKTTYTYDESGNMTSVTDANGNTTEYAYDTCGHCVRAVNAIGQTAESTYDVCGNIITETDFGGKLTTYTYDAMNRIKTKTNTDGTITYSYNNDGTISSVSDRSGVTYLTYSGEYGLSKITYPNNRYVEYSYDLAGRLKTIITQYSTTSYEYDLLDRISSVTDGNGNKTGYRYDKCGNRSQIIYPNGITVNYEYDSLNRLILETTVDSQGECISQYSYKLGLAGERLSADEFDRSVSYEYDNLYRLVGETVTENGETTEYKYKYDSVSNRISKSENGEVEKSEYNELNQLISAGSMSYEYDASGNLIAVTSAERNALYVYNASNKLISSTVNIGNTSITEQYEYDYSGNRTAKKSDDGKYVYYLNNLNSELSYALAELDAGGNLLCIYTAGYELVSQQRNGDMSYYLTDGHASVRQLADQSGAITDKYIYDAWGNMTYSEGHTANSHLYCGEQYDAVTGLYYLRARYMDPSTGRFISMDTYSGSTADPITLHKYLYANANPVSNSDPTGYFSLGGMCCAMAIASIIGGISSGILNALTRYRQNDETSTEDIIINFCNGYVSGAIFGAIFGAIGYLGQVYAICNIIIMGFAIAGALLSFMKASEYFMYEDDPLLGCIYVGLGLLSLFGGYKGFKGYKAVRANEAAMLNSSKPVLVVRWGKSGLGDGSWVMIADDGGNQLPYAFSCKWQIGLGNKFAPPGSYEVYEVPGNQLSYPSGAGIDGWIKTLFGQWIYHK